MQLLNRGVLRLGLNRGEPQNTYPFLSVILKEKGLHIKSVFFFSKSHFSKMDCRDTLVENRTDVYRFLVKSDPLARQILICLICEYCGLPSIHHFSPFCFLSPVTRTKYESPLSVCFVHFHSVSWPVYACKIVLSQYTGPGLPVLPTKSTNGIRAAMQWIHNYIWWYSSVR